jgi:serine/threonine protein kinase
VRNRHARVLSAPERFGKYELLELVGKGGMAEVFLARASGPKGFARQLAIKRILPHMTEDEEFVDMFVHEAKLSASLTHGNIVPIYEFGEVDDQLFLAMEYVEGTTLRALLRELRLRSERVSADTAVFVASEVLRALAYAHARRGPDDSPLELVHRDVSPSNILLSHGGEVKLCDFGIAKAASRHTVSGRLKGKFAYMSPEQAGGKALDARSDLFSVGVVLWEMLSGAKLFQGDSDLSVLDQVRAADIRELPPLGIRDEKLLRRTVERALQRDPADRFPDAATFAAPLRAYLAQAPDVDPAQVLQRLVSGVEGTDGAPEPTPGSGVVPSQRDDEAAVPMPLPSIASENTTSDGAPMITARPATAPGPSAAADQTAAPVAVLRSTRLRPAILWAAGAGALVVLIVIAALLTSGDEKSPATGAASPEPTTPTALPAAVPVPSAAVPPARTVPSPATALPITPPPSPATAIVAAPASPAAPPRDTAPASPAAIGPSRSPRAGPATPATPTTASVRPATPPATAPASPPEAPPSRPTRNPVKTVDPFALGHR